MAGLEELKKKLEPLFDSENDPSFGMSMNPCDSYMVSDGGTVNLLSRSYGVYNINELGLQKHPAVIGDEAEIGEKTYCCASHEMHVFGTIGCGASSVVQRAVKIPIHRIMALKKINVFEKEKRQQLLNEIRTLCEASCYPGLVEFHGAFYTPESGQISIALEYVDGGSLADILRLQKLIPEAVLSCMVQKLLHGLSYLHGVRRLVHRDLKPANLLINLKGETKITDFGVSAGLDNSVAMCATFVGTVTYMSPERIRNESYSYAADIWSLGLTILECGTGKFPYMANEGPANLMLQILYDTSPTPPKDSFSLEFCSFIDACLQKESDARPTAEQMLAIHYYMLFDGSDELWHHMKTFYTERSTFSFSGKTYTGQNDIFSTLSDIRRKLAGCRPQEKIVHVVQKLQCRPHEHDGVAIRASGSFILGSHFLICGNGVQAEGMPNIEELSLDVDSKSVGTFYEQFIMESGNSIGSFLISKQELYILQA
ncbi:mitogen-activated protein kinase kinase 3-like isoform X2 [Musa acuminata AAA Group]|uniref:mitogen-activated protein kinase kinase 3-like isoform X2 n=1 Tax=Musa acuminata AAA Group TaxID=214697 RepID=UPI0031E37C5A